MQNKNLILFIVLAALILGGWFYLQQILPPPTPAKKAEDIAKNAKKDEKTIEPVEKEKEQEKDKEKEKKDTGKKPAPPVLQQVTASPDVTIGGDRDSDYHIQAVLTSKGAGVRRLVLNRFKAASWLGKPEDRNLQLIQDDPIQPSFRLYHFPGGDAEAKPVFGMGEVHWKLVDTRKDDKGDVNEVAYSTQVPGSPHIEITRTYRVEPGSYHLGLTLQMHNTRKDGAPVPFRYQLTGSHGLPIEGEWYTSIFRNAVIAQVDGRSVYRDLEGADRISHRAGGEKVPQGDRSGFVQYAGVMNQYFASLIVPDDLGDDYKNHIAWARATNESSEIKGIIQKIDADKEEVEFTEIGATKVHKTHTYRLLPRAREHIAALDLTSGAKAVLSWYETPDGTRVATWIRAGHALRPQFDDATVRVNSEQVQLKPDQKIKHRFLLYHGPVKTSLLGYLSGAEAVDPDLVERYTHTLHLNTLTDYASPGVIGNISQTIRLTDVIIAVTKAMHWLLWIISSIVPRPLSGVTIIL
jgi:YidC/Oxa1 family membrane protein insertase